MKTYPVGVFPRVVAIAVILLFGATGVGHAGDEVAVWGNNAYGQCVLPNGLKGIKAIAGGGTHSLALKADGTVIAWGRNTAGQSNVPPGLSGVVAIAGGGQHSLALKSDGSVVAWGYAYYGVTEVPAGLSHVSAIAAGDLHSLALKADGTVAFWGIYYAGVEPISTNLPSGLSNVIAIAAGSSHSLALKADGTVVAWGWNNTGQTNVPIGLSNVVAIEAGLYHSIALKADGTVVTWGDGSFGQTNVPPGLSDVTAVKAGSDSCLALRADGSLVSWGGGLYGVTNGPPAGITNVTAIACGGTHNLALVGDGPPEIIEQPANLGVAFQSNVVLSVVARGFEPLSYRWSFNGYPLSASARISGATNAALTISNAEFSDIGIYSVTVSNGLGVVQSTGAVITVISPPIITSQPTGQTVIAGTNISLSVAAIGTPPLSYQWLLEGAPLAGATKTSLSLSNVQSSQSGNYSLRITNVYGVTDSSNALVTVLDSPPYILTQPTNRTGFLGGATAFSVNARGSTPLSYQWRFNGTNIPGATNSALTLTSLRYDQAGFYTVAISNAFDVTVSAKAQLSVNQVAVWGSGTFAGSLTNVPTGLTNLATIAAGERHLLALKSDGTVTAWGYAIPNRTRPPYDPSTLATNVPTGLNGIIAIAAGSSHNLAVRSNGTVVAWGDNSYGQTNVPAGLSNVIAVAAGDLHSLALKADGRVVVWGARGLFFPPYSYSALTNVPPGLSNVVAIAAGFDHNLALKSDGKVVAWGFLSSATNVPANASNLIAIACGEAGPIGRTSATFNLALRSDGTVVSWVTGTYAQLSEPWVSPWPPPTGLSNVVGIAAGGHGMAQKADGSVVMWGLTNPPPPQGLSNIFAVAAGYGFAAAVAGDGSPRFTIQPARQTVTNGAKVQFHVRSVGVQPLSYQWQLDGANLPGATSADLTITNAHGRDTGDYRVLVTNALGTATSLPATLTIPFSTNLGAALNATNLFWSNTIPAAPWFAQLQQTHDADVAAQSGDITDGQQSVLQTTVTGPGMFTFWWKVSSEEGYDFLKLFVDGAAAPLASLSGESDWQQASFAIASGPHTVTWSYAKDGSVSSGADAGWLDEVVFTPAPTITLQPLAQTVWVGSNVTLHATASSAVIAFYQWLKNGTNLPSAFGSFLTLTNVGRRDSGDYALRISNAGGTTTSSNAALVVRVPQFLASPRFLPVGTFAFAAGDADGGGLLPSDLAGFEVQASTNLFDWITLTNACTLTNGTLLLHDSDSTHHPQRFYRLMER